MKQVWVDVEDFVGKTFESVTGMEKDSSEIIFKFTDGTVFRMYHEQDCCESVWLEDICGDESDLITGKVLSASERTSIGESHWGTYTWTFYDIQTDKGWVNFRWCGESNGYYSESVDVAQVLQ